MTCHFMSAPLKSIDLNADDVTITSSADCGSIGRLQESLDTFVSEVFNWALANRLPLSEKKTKVLTVKGKRLSIQINNNLKITCNSSLLTNVMNVKLLGLETDEKLTFSEHIMTVCKKVTQCIGLLKKITNHLPLKQRLLYYNALIKPVINYTSVLRTNCDKESLERVLKLQKRPARVILNAPPSNTINSLFNRLKWLPFYYDALISKCIIAYRRLQDDVSVYLDNLLKLNSNIHKLQFQPNLSEV